MLFRGTVGTLALMRKGGEELDKKNEQIFDIIRCDAKVLEMVTEDALLNVPVHPSINIDVITADDPDPKFVNVEVLRGGVISGNGRRYHNENAKQLVNLIPGKHGFLGHPDPSKYGFEFREPQCIYVGAMQDTLSDGTVRCVAKCYLLKSSRLREWIPKSIAANNPMTVSINGSADVIYNGEYIDVVTINNLESIDWANPGTEGVSTSQAMSVVREMDNNNNNGGTNMEVKDVMKNITVTELKAYNPEAYAGILRSATLQEMQANNPALVKQIEDSARITEMALTIGGKQETVKLGDIQAKITEMEGKVTAAEGALATAKLTEFKQAKIAEMIPEDLREQVSKRVTGGTEQAIIDSINAEIGYIREMRGLGPNDPIGVNTRGASGAHGGEEDIKEMVGGIFGAKVFTDKSGNNK